MWYWKNRITTMIMISSTYTDTDRKAENMGRRGEGVSIYMGKSHMTTAMPMSIYMGKGLTSAAMPMPLIRTAMYTGDSRMWQTSSDNRE